jgi:hypothetical protein
MFANGFEGHEMGLFSAVSAFEVLEHLVDPVQLVSTAIEQAGS